MRAIRVSEMSALISTRRHNAEDGIFVGNLLGEITEKSRDREPCSQVNYDVALLTDPGVHSSAAVRVEREENTAAVMSLHLHRGPPGHTAGYMAPKVRAISVCKERRSLHATHALATYSKRDGRLDVPIDRKPIF
jgi:hypothetical protein